MSVQNHDEPVSVDTHDKRWLERVRPEGWTNPHPALMYNLVVIGAGSAGLVTAAGAAALGARVALVEQERMGGDCLNTGCVPSKSLIRPSRLAHEMRNASKMGLSGGVNVSQADFAAVMERLRRIRANISVHDAASRFRDELGIDLFFGRGFFTGANIISVGGDILRFKKAVIATGAKPLVPPLPGLAGSGFLTSDTVFSLTRRPTHLIVIGGGPIGCELAQAFVRLGAYVSLIEGGGTLLPNEDKDASRLIQEALIQDGVTLHLNAMVSHVTFHKGEKVVGFNVGGVKQQVAGDAILVAVGRSPNVEGLGLSAAGIDSDPRGIIVNERLQTTNPCVYAAGDCCMTHKFTHVADASARIVIGNALFGGRARVDSLNIPWCIYTDPEVAHIGVNEKDAQKQGLSVDAVTIPMAEVDRAVTDGRTDGFVRLYLKKGTDRIVGATIAANRAGEMIGEVAVAMAGNVGLKKIARAVFPYPTYGETIRKAADLYNRGRLTPVVKRLLGAWMKWRLR
ncbi:MAG: mercuric reductase [Thermodesulfobacteriota bacterium]